MTTQQQFRRSRVQLGQTQTSTSKQSDFASRRSLLAAKAAFALGEGTIFPALTEIYTRPVSPENDERAAPLSVRALKSILPADTPAEKKAQAKEAFKEAEAALADQDFAKADALYSEVFKLVPREYKVCQASGLGRSKARKALGDREGALHDSGAVWWWGRGLRWPGWYIIAYLSARSVKYDFQQLRAAERKEEILASQKSRKSAFGKLFSKDAAVDFDNSEFTVSEGSIYEIPLIAILGTGYLALLSSYGLVDL